MLTIILSQFSNQFLLIHMRAKVSLYVYSDSNTKHMKLQIQCFSAQLPLQIAGVSSY